MYDGYPGEIDFGSTQREVRVSEGSSYRESTANAKFHENFKNTGKTLKISQGAIFLKFDIYC